MVTALAIVAHFLEVHFRALPHDSDWLLSTSSVLVAGIQIVETVRLAWRSVAAARRHEDVGGQVVERHCKAIADEHLLLILVLYEERVVVLLSGRTYSIALLLILIANIHQLLARLLHLLDVEVVGVASREEIGEGGILRRGLANDGG